MWNVWVWEGKPGKGFLVSCRIKNVDGFLLTWEATVHLWWPWHGQGWGSVKPSHLIQLHNWPCGLHWLYSFHGEQCQNLWPGGLTSGKWDIICEAAAASRGSAPRASRSRGDRRLVNLTRSRVSRAVAPLRPGMAGAGGMTTTRGDTSWGQTSDQLIGGGRS